MSALDVAQIITAGAAAVAAGVAVWQSRMTQHQLDITMRPWLSAEYNAVIYNTNGQVIVPFRIY
ncbi:MAG: hypothetical protein ACRD5H_06990 [Nitrososphaerales archaeon]